MLVLGKNIGSIWLKSQGPYRIEKSEVEIILAANIQV